MKNLVQESLNESYRLTDDEKEELITFIENKEIKFDNIIKELEIDNDSTRRLENFFHRAINDVADKIIYKINHNG